MSALLHLRLGDVETAELNCNQALEIERDFADALVVRAIVRLLQEVRPIRRRPRAAPRRPRSRTAVRKRQSQRLIKGEP